MKILDLVQILGVPKIRVGDLNFRISCYHQMEVPKPSVHFVMPSSSMSTWTGGSPTIFLLRTNTKVLRTT